eukprot:4873777-Pleurochrysis_carterae.AAC.2
MRMCTRDCISTCARAVRPSTFTGKPVTQTARVADLQRLAWNAVPELGDARQRRIDKRRLHRENELLGRALALRSSVQQAREAREAHAAQPVRVWMSRTTFGDPAIA